MKKQVERDVAMFAFVADRVAIDPSARNKNVRKQLQGKNLNYTKCDAITRRGLDESREKEWSKWREFFAVHLVRGEEMRKLLRDGHQMIPTQWIEEDKAEHKRRRGGPYVPPEFKSRLVACGNC